MQQAIYRLIDTIVDGVITIDECGRIQDFNAACERLFGYDRDEVIGHNVKMLMPEPYRDEHDTYLDSYQTTHERKIIGIGREVTGQRKDGTTFPMELSVGELTNEDSRAFVGVIRDITDRKRLEQDLRDSDAQHRAVIETAVDGVIIIDSLGTVRMFNPACEAMFGFESAEVIGRNVKMLMPSPYYDEHDSYLANYAQTGEKKIIGIGREVIGRRSDGTTFPMELSVGEMSMGSNRFFVGILRDLTRAKKVEEALRSSEAELKERVTELETAQSRLQVQSDEMQELVRQSQIAREEADRASKAKSDFLAIMSHEIRTPLNAVLGFAELLMNQELDDENQRYARIIHQAGDSLLTILNDLLDLSKIELGRMELESQDFRLRDVAEHAVNLWESRAEEKNLYFKLNLDPRVPEIIVGDPARFRQILFNLISNAIKFTEKGGVTVTVRLDDTKGEDARLRIEVSDTGIGIDKESQVTIFGAFSQAESYISRRFGGTGLGLNICSRLVDLMGGSIGVESEPNEGSTFWLSLPLEEGKSVVSFKHKPEARRIDLTEILGRPLNVLYAEDNEFNQLLFRSFLEKENQSIDIVDDGLKAVSAVGKKPYDVVLMDISMPNLDGLSATRRIRENANPKVANLPIIAVTANAMPGDRERYLEAGIDDYVSKPLDQRDLAQTIVRVLSGDPSDGSGQSRRKKVSGCG